MVFTTAQTFLVGCGMLRDEGSNMPDTASRTSELRHMLSVRRREIQGDVLGRIRDGRANRPNEVRDDLEHSDADFQEDIELALLQMRAETLTRFNEALVRLEAGTYGSCFECESEIPERRLRALPFAVRCQACEAAREQERGNARQLAQQRGSFSLFPDLVGS